MYNLIISSFTKSVTYEERALLNLPNLPIPQNVKALYWNATNNTGWVENTDDNGVYIGNTDITEIPQWANECISLFETEWNKQHGSEPIPEPPHPPEPLDACTRQARIYLYQTDWAEMPSVSDPANTPHLLNLNEFLAYRVQVRALMVNPVENPVFPTMPTAQWSN